MSLNDMPPNDRPVDLVLPDAGPIISLAHADRLELLDLFERPVAVLDVVERECLRREDSPDHERLRAWFTASHNRLRRVATPFIGLYETALAKDASGENPRATRGMGDATLVWFLSNVDLVVEPDSIPLILTEDRDLSVRIRGLVAHVLSTRSRLIGLEGAGLIPDAAAVVEEVGRHGRGLSRLIVDQPARSGDARTSWAASLRRERE